MIVRKPAAPPPVNQTIGYTRPTTQHPAGQLVLDGAPIPDKATVSMPAGVLAGITTVLLDNERAATVAAVNAVIRPATAAVEAAARAAADKAREDIDKARREAKAARDQLAAASKPGPVRKVTFNRDPTNPERILSVTTVDE